MRRPGPVLPPVIGGKYRPVRLIAKGGMGAVYEVVHANTGEHLALKLMLARSLLAPDLVERFQREARIHSAVQSEHVVRVIDADVALELDDAPFLVMELLDGHDFERLCVESPPAVAEAVDWLRQLAPALDKAHREGIVHRDLKPENLFLANREGRPPIPKILDFGIAKMDGEWGGHSTATGQILGTPRYMAPEQAIGAKGITAAADRFALGLIAFRLLGGRHYFEGDNWVALLREVARGSQTRPSAMGVDRGPAFDAWFARACAFRPDDRFPTAVEQIDALAAVLIATGKRRRSWTKISLVVGALAAVLLAAWPMSRWAASSKHAPAASRVAMAPSPASPLPPAPAQKLPVPEVELRPTSVPPVEAASEPRAVDGTPPRPRHRKRGELKPDLGTDLIQPVQDRIWDEP